MARPAYPRPAGRHETIAAGILRRHAQLSEQPIVLPVPIELIIEQTYGLDVVYDVIEERPGEMILGALIPSERRILINSTHQELLDEVIGPERFTLAHELAHWVYDAENPDQMTLEFDSDALDQVFCYHRESPGLTDGDQIREVNANKLAAALLMPVSLLTEAEIPASEFELRHIARQWGVSYQALTIRLEQLGLG